MWPIAAPACKGPLARPGPGSPVLVSPVVAAELVVGVGSPVAVDEDEPAPVSLLPVPAGTPGSVPLQADSDRSTRDSRTADTGSIVRTIGRGSAKNQSP